MTNSRSNKRAYYPEKARTYYENNKEAILQKAKARYAVKSEEERHELHLVAKKSKDRKRDKIIEEKKKAGINPKDRYAQARLLGYRSMFEVSIAKAAEQTGVDIEYEPFFIPYVIKGNYRPDFIIKKNGIIIEAKGYLDTAACKKMLAVKHSNPHLDIRFIFQDINGRRNKRSKMRYWEWCEKHGFQYAQGTIPLAWLKEKKKSLTTES